MTDEANGVPPRRRAMLKVNGISPEIRRLYRHYRQNIGFSQSDAFLIVFGMVASLDALGKKRGDEASAQMGPHSPKPGAPTAEASVTDNFLADVDVEVGFQDTRWGQGHDALKSDVDWVNLVDHILGKATRPGVSLFKKRHRLRAAAGVLAAWDRHVTTTDPDAALDSSSEALTGPESDVIVLSLRESLLTADATRVRDYLIENDLSPETISNAMAKIATQGRLASVGQRFETTDGWAKVMSYEQITEALMSLQKVVERLAATDGSADALLDAWQDIVVGADEHVALSINSDGSDYWVDLRAKAN